MPRWGIALVALCLGACVGAAKLGKVPGLEEPSSPEAGFQQAVQLQFQQADVDGNGELSAQEFQDSMMQAVGSAGQLEQAQLDQYARMLHAKFSDFDSDQSNGISMAEWQALSQAGQQAAEDSQKKQAAQKNAQLKALFDKADSEQADGKLTQVEMLSGFAQYGYDSAQIQAFFKMGDADKDAMLTFDEFLRAREGMQRAKDLEAMMDSAKSEDEQLKAFADADINADGKLSVLEYTKAFEDFLASMGGDTSAIDAKQISETFAQFDTDGDGKVTQAEWMDSVKRNLGSSAEAQALNDQVT